VFFSAACGSTLNSVPGTYSAVPGTYSGYLQCLGNCSVFVFQIALFFKCLHVGEGVVVGGNRAQRDHHYLVDAVYHPTGHAAVRELRETGAEAFDCGELLGAE